MQPKQIYTIFLSIFIIFSFLNYCGEALAFIRREYTLKEVLDASTNVVYGRLTSVDKKRMRAIARIQENLKGKSGFKQIKMNIAVGQTQGKLTSPQMMMKRLNEGLPLHGNISMRKSTIYARRRFLSSKSIPPWRRKLNGC